MLRDEFQRKAHELSEMVQHAIANDAELGRMERGLVEQPALRAVREELAQERRNTVVWIETRKFLERDCGQWRDRAQKAEATLAQAAALWDDIKTLKVQIAGKGADALERLLYPEGR